MANNLTIKDANRVTQNLRSTETDGVHTPHNIVKTEEGNPLEVSITGLQGGALAITSSVANPVHVTGDLGVSFDLGDVLQVKTSIDAPLFIKSLMPSKVTKSKLTNYDEPYLISWDGNQLGSFRIAKYDDNRKYLTIFNDSIQDLHISVAENENSQIAIKVADLAQLDNLTISYTIKKVGVDYQVFNYTASQILSAEAFYTDSGNTIGSGLYSEVKKDGDEFTLYIYLTPDYFNTFLNKDNEENIGTFKIKIGTPEATIELDKTQSYQIFNYYAEFDGTGFINPTLTRAVPIYKNGFDTSDIITEQDLKGKKPEGYSYIIYASDALTIYDTEAVLEYYGYFLKPLLDTTKLTLRVTEAR